MPRRPPGELRLLGRLLAYARPYWPWIAVSIGFSLVYAGGLTGRAYLVGPLLDGIVLPSAQASSLEAAVATADREAAALPELEEQRRTLERRIAESWGLVLGAAALLILVMPPARMVRDYTGEWVMTRVLVDVQADLARKLLRLPLGRHQSDRRGDFVSRALNDTSLANRAQSLVFGEALQDVTIVVVASAAMFWVNWRLALVGAAVGPPIALVLVLFGRRIRRTSLGRQRQISEVTQRLVQMLAGIKVIKAFRAEATEDDAFVRELARYFRRSLKVIRNRVLSRTAVELVSQIAFVALLLIGVLAVVGGRWDLTVGQLAAFVFLSGMTYRPMKNLTRLYTSIQDALPAAERLFEVMDAGAEPADPPDAVEVAALREGVRFRGVCFDYGRERVLNGVDLEIRAGEVVALVGRTGAGKTTLADLLLRFHDPTAGSIELDGVDLRRIRRDSLRELIAVVTQEAFLFDTTVLENVRYGRPEASVEEVVEAARAANVHEFVESLPEGYETRVGELGAQLSGGQRQRLTIARAILRDPGVLIFDEATSALDAKAELLVQEAVWNLMKGRTVLIIAHRLATVTAAHRIAVLEGGRITAIGTHEELLARDGLYRELCRLQFGESAISA